MGFTYRKWLNSDLLSFVAVSRGESNAHLHVGDCRRSVQIEFELADWYGAGGVTKRQVAKARKKLALLQGALDDVAAFIDAAAANKKKK